MSSTKLPINSSNLEPGLKSHASKVFERRYRWEWNRKLISLTLVGFAILGAVFTGSYFYHSAKTASTFLSRSELANQDGRYDKQALWLARYSLMRPNDTQAIYNTAMASDKWADAASPGNRSRALDKARERLGAALGRLGNDNAELSDQIRVRLIQRLLDLGGAWLREAERQIASLGRPENDPEANKWLAIAMAGQVNSDIYQVRRDDFNIEDKSYWERLVHEPVGEVLIQAIKLNPGDMELIAELVELARVNRDLFNTNGKTAAERSVDLERRINECVHQISGNQDSQSRVILYRNLTRVGKNDEARRLLLEFADETTARLDTSVDDSVRKGDRFSSVYWDFMLVSEAGRLIAETQPEKAYEFFSKLTQLEKESVPKEFYEEVFLFAGDLEFRNKEFDKALETWESGLSKLNFNSLRLLGAIARLQIYRDDRPAGTGLDEQKAAIDRLEKAIDFVSLELAKTPERELQRESRIAIASVIDTSRWGMNALKTILNTRLGKSHHAIEELEELLASQVQVALSERIAVAQQLAGHYGRAGNWDQVAATRDRIVELEPGNIEYRQAAADAWMRAGNRLHAIQHWRMLGNSGSIPIQVASLEAQFYYRIRLNAEQRDFNELRPKIVEIENRIQKEANPDDPEIRAATRKLEVVKVSIPPVGNDIEAHLDSQEFADSAGQLAKKYPEDRTIQAFAAERLARAGKMDESGLAVERLEKLDGQNSPSVIQIRAQILAIKGDYRKACDVLMNYASSEEKDLNKMLAKAASLALIESDFELAYQALTKIPDENRSIPYTYQLTQLAENLPADSKYLQNTSSEQLALSWRKKLDELEGDNATYGPLLDALKIAKKLLQSQEEVDPNDPSLARAHNLVQQILTQRPSWGDAIAVEGWILSLENRPAAAIEQLRRGIASGDVKVTTRQILWRELVKLNRLDEAEREIQTMDWATRGTYDEYSLARISIAQQKKDYERSLIMAREVVENSPQDYFAHLILARTLAVAGKKADDDSKKNSRFAESRAAIKKATSALAGMSAEIRKRASTEIAATELSVEQEIGDEIAIRKTINDIQQRNEIDKYDRLMVAANGLKSLNDFKSAVSVLVQADQLKPSTKVKLQIAVAYRKLNQPDQEIEMLRTAHDNDITNAGLRNKLALAIATRDGENVDWNELGNLLQSTTGQSLAVNQFMYALLLSTHGDDAKRESAIEILRALVKDNESQSTDSARLLAVVLRRQLKETTEATNQAQRDKRILEVRSLYESLIREAKPETTDYYRYADFLLNLKEKEDLPTVRQILNRLKSDSQGTLAALDIGVRYATATGKKDSAPGIVSEWAAGAVETGVLGSADASVIAGTSLVKLGFAKEGLAWLSRAYAQNAEIMLQPYVAALNKLGQVELALKICTTHQRTYEDVSSAILLGETMLNTLNSKDSDVVTQQHVDIVEEALKKYPNNVVLLESIATWKMQQEEYEAAIALYHLIDKLSPNRIRTLNNLAMAYSEVPGIQQNGIEPIQRALKLANNHPELMDTYGVVLLGSGKFSEAENVFRQALQKLKEPRFRFHLILTLMELDNVDTARSEWSNLKLQDLKLAGLTKREREKLEELKIEFGSSAEAQK